MSESAPRADIAAEVDGAVCSGARELVEARQVITPEDITGELLTLHGLTGVAARLPRANQPWISSSACVR